MSYLNPLERFRSVSENEHFRKANTKALDAMRARKHAREIGDATGITDEDLMAHLVALGIDVETVRILHLVPLVQMAWADGAIQSEERALIELAAQARGVDERPKAKALLQAMLEEPPSAEVCNAALDFCRLVLNAEGEDGSGVESLQQAVLRVAEAHGGFFGIGAVTDGERRALEQIGERLHR
ncbi:MAG: hypothetical protein VX405_05975 [Myxococcota bacterium]|jgi:hypothetical protein|nr:hypothetical protein [Myxococcales bacterium]MEC7751035.1 hypothetical protein [Myxococcota bacterium]